MFSIKSFKKRLLRKSVFGHFFHRDGVTCAYNVLNMTTIYFNSWIYPFILRATETPISEFFDAVSEEKKMLIAKVLTKICRANVFVPREYDELSFLSKVQDLIFKGPRIRVLVLHLTDFCNLRCHYCFIEKNIPRDYKREKMSEEIVERSIDKFGQVIKDQVFSKPPSVVLYGGEPISNWNVLKHCLKYLQQRQKSGEFPKKIDRVLITNGTLITPQIARELKEFGVLVSVSIDGPQIIHDLNRVYRNGKGSFEATIRGFRILQEAGVKPTISCVLSREGIPHVLETVRWLFDALKVTAIGFNHVSIVPNVSTYDPVYEANFGEALIQVQEMIQSEYGYVYERRMNHKINCFLERRILRADCTGCGEQMSVSPDGEIGICQGYMGNRKTFSGSVFDAKYNPHRDPTFIEWSRRSPLNMPKCFSCPALATCGGGCPRNADFINGSIWEVDSAFCHFAKRAQEWMIWKKYDTERS